MRKLENCMKDVSKILALISGNALYLYKLETNICTCCATTFIVEINYNSQALHVKSHTHSH